MSERPWLEGSDPALRGERALLKRLNAQEPPVGSVEQGWAALSAEISAGAPLDPTQGLSPAAPGAAGIGVAAKAALGVAVAAGLLWGGSALLSPSDTSAPSPRLAPAESVPSANRAEPTLPTQPDVSPPSAATSATRPIPRPQSSTTTLAEEGRLLAKAHQLVQAGQASQALEVLRSSETRFPRSALAQEREALMIEALSRAGSTAAARQRAERFLKRFPNSPHASRLTRFVE